MKILFCERRICERGTSVALYDYADYNEKILGNKSVICHTLSDINPIVSLRFIKRFGHIYYTPSIEAIDRLCEIERIDAVYMIKSGENDGFLARSVPNLIHYVFRGNEPHGERYVAVSDWLAEQYHTDFVPHMTALPLPTGRFIVMDRHKPIVGRIGGYDTFDIPWVWETMAATPDVDFALVNTKPLLEAPNIFHLPAIVDPQTKANFYASCDAVLHGRQRGETFGLAIVEPLSLDVPVLAWSGGEEQHHVSLLRDTRLLYNDADQLKERLAVLEHKQKEIFHDLVSQFQPEPVMERFQNVFLNGI